jgi:hypothetical protein
MSNSSQFPLVDDVIQHALSFLIPKELIGFFLANKKTYSMRKRYLDTLTNGEYSAQMNNKEAPWLFGFYHRMLFGIKKNPNYCGPDGCAGIVKILHHRTPKIKDQDFILNVLGNCYCFYSESAGLNTDIFKYVYPFTIGSDFDKIIDHLCRIWKASVMTGNIDIFRMLLTDTRTQSVFSKVFMQTSGWDRITMMNEMLHSQYRMQINEIMLNKSVRIASKYGHNECIGTLLKYSVAHRFNIDKYALLRSNISSEQSRDTLGTFSYLLDKCGCKEELEAHPELLLDTINLTIENGFGDVDIERFVLVQPLCTVEWYQQNQLELLKKCCSVVRTGEIMQLLIDHVNITMHNNIALRTAIKRKNMEIVKLLMSNEKVKKSLGLV